MTDPTLSADRELAERREDERGKVTAIWVLYLVALFTGLTLVIGAVLAYVFRGNAPDWLRDHYDKQIAIFWWGVFWVVVGTLTIPVFGIGVVILGLSWLWVLIRSVQGLTRVNEGRAFRK
ncbi:DUF4870 family protein [Parvularcula dongshanensis]|uniref:Putative membrane protein n=1 Tax=Parvularcula dongshanensis TaxID=1173995 RepID=A0A840I4B9_9PROT|nr:hypothetical protein [Parvularcula dongshanensis]MBB4659709.1 putative membrane protein [Parvularcula dongshanensis]